MRIPEARGALGALLLLATTALAPAQSSCSPNGLFLNWGGTTRLGDAYSIDLLGTSSVSGLLGADVIQGPVPSPIGLVCLGLSQQLVTIPFSLDVAGHFSLGGVLPTDPSYYGVQAWLQAAAVDPTQPNGFALSNGAHPVLRPPRVWIVAGPGSPGALCVYDTITEMASPAITLPSTAIQAAAVSQLGWLAVLVAATTAGAAPRLMAIDATGATQLDLPLAPPAPTNLVVDGTTVYVLSAGGGVGSVRAFSFPSGAAGLSVPLGFAPSQPLIAHPGSGVVFVQSGLTVVPVDVANGVVLSPINLNQAPGSSLYFADWAYQNGIIYCMLSGSGIFGASSPFQLNAIDVSTLTAVHASTVLLPSAGGASRLTWAVDAIGPGLLTSSQGSLLHVSPTTLQATAVLNVTANGAAAAVSAGGSELMLTGYGPAGLTFEVVGLNPFQILGSPSGGGTPTGPPLPVPSTTFRKAYVVKAPGPLSAQNQLAGFGTDPLTSLQTLVPLPLAAANVFAVVD